MGSGVREGGGGKGPWGSEGADQDHAVPHLDKEAGSQGPTQAGAHHCKVRGCVAVFLTVTGTVALAVSLAKPHMPMLIQGRSCSRGAEER